MPASRPEERVLIIAPLGQDAPAMAAMLQANRIATLVCPDPAQAAAYVAAGTDALLMTEETLELPRAPELLEALKSQPAWSELPLIILTRGGESRVGALLDLAASAAGSLMLLERPMSAATLLRTVQVALNSRRRQYQLRDLLAERKQAEDALRESRERLRLAANAARLFAFEWNPVTDLVRREGDAPAILGVQFQEETGASFFGRVHPDDRERFVGLLRSLHPGSDSYSTIYRVLRPDGTECVLEESGRAFFDGEARFVRLIGMTADITERHRTEEALRQNEEQFRAMFSVASVGKAQADPVTGRLLRVNAALCRMTGFTEPELLTRTVRDLTHPEDREHSWAAFSRMASGEAEGFDTEKRYVRADGQTIHVHVSANLIRDTSGRPFRTAAVIHDITDRKRAEVALRESEQRLRIAQTAAELGIFDWNLETDQIHCDARFRQIWGTNPDQELTKSILLKGIDPDDRTAAEAILAAALDPAGAGHLRLEFRVVRNGRTRWLGFTGQTTFEDGKAQRIVGTVQDITGRKEFQGELERLVAERTRRLQELVNELEHFSYSITHDMRAPLRSMAGFAEMAAELCGSAEVEQQKSLLQRISQSTARMDALITDALSYSEAVRKHLPLAPVDPNLLLRGMLDSYPEFQASRASIQIQPAMPHVFANEAGLTQCFSNLLTNAIKFTPPGKLPQIRVWAELTKGPAPATGDLLSDPKPFQPAGFTPVPSLFAAGKNEGRSEEWVRIWIEDQGIGISPSLLPRVFNMFSRGSTVQTGTGIGLALVRKVVDRMGGRVDVQSEEGKGSRFWIELLAAS